MATSTSVVGAVRRRRARARLFGSRSSVVFLGRRRPKVACDVTVEVLQTTREQQALRCLGPPGDTLGCVGALRCIGAFRASVSGFALLWFGGDRDSLGSGDHRAEGRPPRGTKHRDATTASAEVGSARGSLGSERAHVDSGTFGCGTRHDPNRGLLAGRLCRLFRGGENETRVDLESTENTTVGQLARASVLGTAVTQSPRGRRRGWWPPRTLRRARVVLGASGTSRGQRPR
jgi:hypothetical protein